MLTAIEIKSWLALVANAAVATRQAAAQAEHIIGIDQYDLRIAANYLEQAFTNGLEAHGNQAVREYLAEQKSNGSVA